MLKFDKELIDRLLKKDPNAFNEFYSLSVDIFFRYIKSHYMVCDSDAHDLLSSFYYKLWNGIKSFKPGNSFEAWVWTVFKNLIKDYFKKTKEISFSSIYVDENTSYEDEIASDDDVSKLFNIEFEYASIQTALKTLDSVSQEVIFLKFVEEKSHEEISKILSISNDNVRQRLSRAIKKLRDLLK